MALTLVSLPLVGLATTEETFEVLQVGSNTYRNVTVTTKGSDYIFIQHSTGMSNLKLAQLSPEVRDQLGYKPEPKKFSSSKDRISSWATQTLGNVDLSRLKQLEQTFRPHSIDGASQPAFDQTQLLSLAAIALPDGVGRVEGAWVSRLHDHRDFCHSYSPPTRSCRAVGRESPIPNTVRMISIV